MWLFSIALSILAVALLSSCHTQSYRATIHEDTVAPPRSPIPSFNAAHAYGLIERQVAFGPRFPNSPGHDSCRLFFLEYLQRYADTVFEQSFVQEVYGKKLSLTNIAAVFRSDLSQRVLLCAHWDTRPYADEDPDPANHSKPILGANDGASGVAILLELARLFAQHPPPVGVDLLLLDGEDYGRASDIEHFCLGSRYAAQHYPFPIRPLWVVVVDLVGDRDAWFPWEEYSWQSARELLKALWNIGKRRFPSSFREELVPPIFDDHVPFIQAGMRALVIIDAELVGNRSPNPRRRYWHTLRDTPENISQESLLAVGQTLVDWIYGTTW